MTNELNHTLFTASKYNMYDIKSNLSGFKCNHSNVALSEIFCLKFSGKKLTKKQKQNWERGTLFQLFKMCLKVTKDIYAVYL